MYAGQKLQNEVTDKCVLRPFNCKLKFKFCPLKSLIPVLLIVFVVVFTGCCRYRPGTAYRHYEVKIPKQLEKKDEWYKNQEAK